MEKTPPPSLIRWAQVRCKCHEGWIVPELFPVVLQCAPYRECSALRESKLEGTYRQPWGFVSSNSQHSCAGATNIGAAAEHRPHAGMPGGTRQDAPYRGRHSISRNHCR